ncbi:enoyl-CoA hydratase [Desulfosarcina ovata]|uniref:Enoyl-CoA hydratase domain-containing protein 3, mitochondrial n=1 Tax=Desulfosarcina ovata subsp. ovata TaxID=2752305 RepID=A0A5K8A971_9BACT|nr:enoyl-CoA hydratase [Desulfosarcina ovata]BBO89087.1 enoyl-CoA hydratase [Desulfosarcina ovata subsp. ovata]
MDYSEITFDREAAVGTLTLNNAGKINALSKQMIKEILQLLDQVAEDDTLKVLIIRAAGNHFCAGHYLAEMVDAGVKAYKSIFDQCTRMMIRIHDIPQVVIAQVQGIATAAGCQLAAWCDLIVAEEGARFSTPGVRIGLFCTTPMVAITRAIGRKAAMEMLVTGREFPAAEAKALGLVNRVVPLAELEATTRDLARQIAGASGFALSIGKQGLYAQADMTDAQALHYAKHTIVMNNMAEDAQTGIKAFLEKRTPEWKNR